jgi:hypothetical protein
LPTRELDDALGLSAMVGEKLADARAGKNGRRALVGILRQAVFGRLAGYELAIPSFGSTAARPNTVRKRVGGVANLRRTPKSRILGLDRRPSGECRLIKHFGR